jgi:hypothetical protein
MPTLWELSRMAGSEAMFSLALNKLESKQIDIPGNPMGLEWLALGPRL